jgi:transcriptional regulator with GAF, ATPase, and Fis domain
MQRLIAYSWPGNVRELENVIERAIILANSSVLEVDSTMLPSAIAAAAQPTQSGSLEAIEREHILRVLQQSDWVIEGPRGAARILEMHPNTLRSRLKKLGISRSSHEPS